MPELNYSSLDLRSYLDFVRQKGKGTYREIGHAISPRWETTAVVIGLAQKLRSPVLYFKSVKHCRMPMVTNVCSSVERVARSVGWSAVELYQKLISATEQNIAPVVVDANEAPVRENTTDLSVFSIREFPQLYYTESQTDPYITSSIVVARDPDSGAHNLSFHRLMICADDSVAIYMTPGGHLDQIWQKNRTGGRPTPVAVVIGSHPLWCYASLVGGALAHDDYGLIGAVLGEPMQLTPGLVDESLLVPARAEIVLEGEIGPDTSQDEGPFGEFLGFVAEKAPRPVIRFSKISHRTEPVYQDVVAGQAEHLTMSSVSLRARLQRNYFQINAAVTDFWLPASMTLFLSIDDSRQADFDAHPLMKRLLDEERYLKNVICFGNEVDLRKQGSVQSALACNVQADTDMRIYPNHVGNGVDPSEVSGKTCKVAIDARAKSVVVPSKLPKDFLDQFSLTDWLE